MRTGKKIFFYTISLCHWYLCNFVILPDGKTMTFQEWLIKSLSVMYLGIYESLRYPQEEKLSQQYALRRFFKSFPCWHSSFSTISIWNFVPFEENQGLHSELQKFTAFEFQTSPISQQKQQLGICNTGPEPGLSHLQKIVTLSRSIYDLQWLFLRTISTVSCLFTQLFDS